MRFVSTRGQQTLSLPEALLQGLAADGGLFVPERIPQANWQNFSGDLDQLPLVAEFCLSPFFEDDSLSEKLSEICHKSFSFPVPINKWNENTYVLELFHGPTAAFKDFGARFLAHCFSALEGQKTVLVATSGDTGGAVAAACFQQKGLNVVLLYPQGRVSQAQELQLTCWGENVHSFAVDGGFDDCQDMVKSLFQNSDASQKFHFTSANSINIGRMLPQMVYYAQASMSHFRNKKTKLSFAIPTGNLGNAVACFYARAMGFPIGKIALCTNANRTLSDYYETAKYRPRPSVETLATAMDVGKPSNFERLMHLYPDFSELKKESLCFSVTDQQIEKVIIEALDSHGQIICPHTATALSARTHLGGEDWAVVATAHPAKFAKELSRFVKQKIALPTSLQSLASRASQVTKIPADEKLLLASLEKKLLPIG